MAPAGRQRRSGIRKPNTTRHGVPDDPRPAGLTHLVTRLERERLVAREVDVSDRRGFHAVLTDEGESRLDASRPLHNQIVRELLLDRMTKADRRELGAIWKRIEARAETSTLQVDE